MSPSRRRRFRTERACTADRASPGLCSAYKKDKDMRIVGNIWWHIPCLGFVQAIVTYLLGLILAVTVIGAPIGLGLMELGKFYLFPFSQAMADKSELDIEQNKIWGDYQTLVMILYLPLGLILTRMLHKSRARVLSRPLDAGLFGPFGACASSSQQVKITRTRNRCHSRCRAHRERLCMRSTNR